MSTFKTKNHDPHLRVSLRLSCRQSFYSLSIRWKLSRYFKTDVNNDYGTYEENGEIVMEVINRNPEYESTTENQDQAAKERRPHSDYENWQDDYDQMG